MTRTCGWADGRLDPRRRTRIRAGSALRRVAASYMRLRRVLPPPVVCPVPSGSTDERLPQRSPQESIWTAISHPLDRPGRNLLSDPARARLGAWLLFAGPVQQAVQELHAQQVEHARLSGRRFLSWSRDPDPCPPGCGSCRLLRSSCAQARDSLPARVLQLSGHRSAPCPAQLPQPGIGLVRGGSRCLAHRSQRDLLDHNEHGWPLVWFAVISGAVTLIAARLRDRARPPR